MNILLNRLPEHVSVHEVDYVINTDFRIGIQFEMLMMDQNQNYHEKIMKAILLYYPKIPSDINQAVEQLLWFYRCDSSLEEVNSSKSSGSVEQVFSYEQDQFMIYTAFLQYYQIDLNAVETLHWWKFKQMFNELPEDCKLKKVMLYRSIRLNSNMSKEQKQFYADMKAIYKLKNQSSEQQKANNFAAILAGGMNIPKE